MATPARHERPPPDLTGHPQQQSAVRCSAAAGRSGGGPLRSGPRPVPAPRLPRRARQRRPLQLHSKGLATELPTPNNMKRAVHAARLHSAHAKVDPSATQKASDMFAASPELFAVSFAAAALPVLPAAYCRLQYTVWVGSKTPKQHGRCAHCKHPSRFSVHLSRPARARLSIGLQPPEVMSGGPRARPPTSTEVILAIHI